VKVIILTRGSAMSRSPTSAGTPGTTFRTPAGSLASSKMSAINAPEIGVSSEGLRTNVFPVASA
jgi:hypothetical protein